MPQFLTDDELLDVPLGNLMPGELTRSFKAHADHAHKIEEADTLHIAQRLDRQTAEEKHEEAEELCQREEIVLTQLAEREAQLREEAERLDERAIKLHDGRRAYVDGDDYRDAEGHKLTGADRAQAEVLHVEQPQAATWQEKHYLDEQAQRTEQMRRNIEDLQAGKAGANEATLLSRYEKQMQSQTPAAAGRESASADYSDTNYMGALSGLTAHPQAKSGPAF